MTEIKVQAVSGERFKVGDYVFACKFGDADINDPWCVDFISEISVLRGITKIRCNALGARSLSYAMHVTREEGRRILDERRVELLTPLLEVHRPRVCVKEKETTQSLLFWNKESNGKYKLRFKPY